MKFIYVQLSYQQDLISCAHLVVFHPSSAPQSFPCRLPSYSVPKTVLVQPLVLIKNSNMPFSTFFTSSLPTRSSGRAAISLLVLLLSGAHAQDRTTEAGEAQIKGVLAEARWMGKKSPPICGPRGVFILSLMDANHPLERYCVYLKTFKRLPLLFDRRS